MDDGIDYVADNITVIKLVERYVILKQGVRHNTKVGYNFVQNILKKKTLDSEKSKILKFLMCSSGSLKCILTISVVIARLLVDSLKRVIENRKILKKEWIINGYTGFLLLDKDNKPKMVMHIEHQMKYALYKYNR